MRPFLFLTALAVATSASVTPSEACRVTSFLTQEQRDAVPMVFTGTLTVIEPLATFTPRPIKTDDWSLTPRTRVTRARLTFAVSSIERGDVPPSVDVLYDEGWVHGPPDTPEQAEAMYGREYRVGAELRSLGANDDTALVIVSGPCTIPFLDAREGDEFPYRAE